MNVLAKSNNLRALVEASKALASFIKIADRADQERSPLLHRLGEKECLQLWSQDLIRIVGKFGPQLVGQPETVFSMLPAFCPRSSIMHTQFGVSSRMIFPWDSIR